MSAVLVTLRRLRQDPAPAVGLGLLVLVTAVVFGLAPRILERVADDSLRKVVADASAFNRNIAVIDEQPIRPGSTADPLSEVASEGDRLTAEMPRSVQALIVDRLTVVDSGRWHIEAPTPDPAFVRFRIQPGAESRIHYVSGHAPTAVVRTIDLPPPATPVPGEDVQPTARVLQVALSVNAVQQIHHGLGETVTLTFDSRDPLVGGPRSGIAAMEIVGVFEVDRPADPFWYEDTALEKVSFRSLGGDSRLIDATALIPADAYEPMLGVVPPDITPVRVTWRSFVGPERMRAGPMNDLIRDLRRLETTFPRSQPATRARDSVAMQSGLLPLIQTHAARWTSALAILTVIAIGPAAVALTALALIAAIVARRRRPGLILVRGR
ncbi:MAG TPA: hypothetical protein VFY18_03660, partial [Candidatus Limnocylindrales bacterium]|nr:hypothetical protein [Candidatus Limnocylindrales bacterium]